MKRIEIPDKSTHFDGEKQQVSMRIPITLVTFLEEVASEKGWNFTELVTYVLDHFAQAEQAIRSAGTKPRQKRK